MFINNMGKKYTRKFRKEVEQEIRVNSSNADIAGRFGIPSGTVAQWRWHINNPISKVKKDWKESMNFTKEPKPLTVKEVRKAYEEAKKTSSNNEGLSINWEGVYIATLIDMGLNAVEKAKEAKRQRLIAYIIGVVIGMAIGSLVMRAIL